MKKLTCALLAISVIFALPSFAAQSSCQIFATTMTKHVVDIFHDSKLSESQKRGALSAVFKEAVDTDWIGRFVLGRFWKTANNDEQAQYLKHYRAYITQNYISKFNDEDGMSVDEIVLSTFAPQTPNQFEAKTLIKRKNEEDVKVDYLLDDTSGKCQVHDIKVEGVSLLTTQRSEFAALAASAGIKGVIEAMQKKSGDISQGN